MRKHIMRTSAALVLALSVAYGCGGSSPTTSAGTGTSVSCVNQAATHRAYVVVVHASQSVVQKCVGFAGETIDAQTLMDQSKVEYQTQTFSFGKAVCQVDNEPVQFSKCFADSGPNWTLFVETNGQWTEAQTGYTEVTLHDKDALGWVYTAQASPPPPPMPKS